MSNFRSNMNLVSYKSCPAVHYIPSSSNANAFGDAISIGAKNFSHFVTQNKISTL